jgi:hypothetical protein
MQVKLVRLKKIYLSKTYQLNVKLAFEIGRVNEPLGSKLSFKYCLCSLVNYSSSSFQATPNLGRPASRGC